MHFQFSGCDTGFGLEAAMKMDRLGLFVFAGCLNPNDPGAMRLRKEGSKRLQVIHLDVTKQLSIISAVEIIEKFCNDNAFDGTI